MKANIAELEKKRNCEKKENSPEKYTRASKQIHVAIEKEDNERLLYDAKGFREKLDEQIEEYPERFPKAITRGYTFHGFTRESKKLEGLRFRRIKLKATKEVYNILPYFVMPYMKGYTEDLEKPLFLRKFGVPYWALTYVFGRNDSFWYRLETGLGQCSITGTTISKAEKMPEHLIADEKFTWENSD